MNIICSIFGHKWKYKIQTDFFVPPTLITSNTGLGYYAGDTDSNGNPIPIEIKKEVRICERCNQKEQKNTGFNRQTFKNTYSWLEDTLTKDEERDLKLKKLLE